MAFHLHILNASGGLSRHIGAIEAAMDRLSPLLDLPHEIDLVIQCTDVMTIPEQGIGGFCPAMDEIRIPIDPAFRAPDFAPKGDFERAVVHETHHALRWAGPGYGRTLGAALVTEGLAGHYVHQVLGTAPEPWETALNADQADALWPLVKSGWDDPTYDHGAWFFGDGDTVPGWGGYTLGFELVGRYLAANPQTSARSLAGADYQDFLSAL